jgi:hypothetical protein
VRTLILSAFMLAGSSQACSLGESDRFQYARPLSPPSESIPAPDVRVESFEIGKPGRNSAVCEGVAVLTLSVSSSIARRGTGLVLEQVTPAPYALLGPHDSFEPSFERGGRQQFVFLLSRGELRSEPINVTARAFVVTADGRRSSSTTFQYSLPSNAAL